MTSLIFGTVYMGHKAIIGHRREKQRQKNYDRWDGLRDDYDEQKRVSRQPLDSLSSSARPQHDLDRPIVTQRDQQEANDARTSWRPQEAFDGRPGTASGNSGGALRKQKTGATWDEGLPERLPVERRFWDEDSAGGGGRKSFDTASSGRGAMSRVVSEESEGRRAASMDAVRPPQRKGEGEFEVVESPYHWWER